MKTVLMVLAVGTLLLGTMVAVGLLNEQAPQPTNVVYYDVPAPVPTQQQFEETAPQFSGAASYAVINVR